MDTMIKISSIHVLTSNSVPTKWLSFRVEIYFGMVGIENALTAWKSMKGVSNELQNSNRWDVLGACRAWLMFLLQKGKHNFKSHRNFNRFAVPESCSDFSYTNILNLQWFVERDFLKRTLHPFHAGDRIIICQIPGKRRLPVPWDLDL